jgi:uncharacterized protein (DUF169 family)
VKSDIAKSLHLKYEPVTIILSNKKPEGARQFKEGKWGCVMFLLAAATKGQTAAFDRKTFGCQGGGVGLGFGNQYRNVTGGEECFCYFLSTGNEQWEQGRRTAEQVRAFLRPEAYEDFVHGERYVQSPELVKKFIECLPMTDVPFEYVLLKPLKDVDAEKERPEVVILLGDMDQIAALTILANYRREGNENVIFPYAAGCQSIGIYALKEARSESPRAVLGLNDISARLSLKRLLKDDVMSFAAPYALFQEMEESVPGSFLERPTWKELMALRSKSG